MPWIEDVDLLRRYSDTGSEEAFAELVRRRVDLVYSVAMRHTHDGHRAGDVTQAVFLALARKAAVLSQREVLIGWLYRSAHFAASDAVRAEQRRQAREKEAFTMEQLSVNEREPDLAEVRPILDDVLNDLGERDRDAILLRFIDGRPFAEIGAKLKLTENAARMRVERALEKMRHGLAQRGFKSSAAVLSAALASQVCMGAPTGLAATVTGSVFAGTTPASGAVTAVNLLKFMGTSKITGILTGAIALAAIGFGVYQAKQMQEAKLVVIRANAERDDLRASLQSLQRRVAEQEQRDKPDMNGRKQAQTGTLPAPALRPQIAGRNLAAEMTAVKDLKNVGNETPSATVESLNWARENGNIVEMGKLISISPQDAPRAAALFATMSADDRAKYSISTPEEMIAFFLSGMGSKFTAVQEFGTMPADNNTITVPVVFQNENGGLSIVQFNVQNMGTGWQWNVPDSVITGVASQLSKNTSPSPGN